MCPDGCSRAHISRDLRAGLPKEETFDSDFHDIVSRRLFFRGLDDEIAQPVLPAVNDTHYLATQVFAEYVIDWTCRSALGVVRATRFTADAGAPQ